MTIILWLFVMNLGIAFGAGLYEHRIVVPQWIGPSRDSGTLRYWWLAAGLAALADRVLTFAYFIPTMIGLMGAMDPSKAVAVAARWWNLNYLRHAIVLSAWLAALKTFAVFYQQRS